jgi:MFS family permease
MYQVEAFSTLGSALRGARSQWRVHVSRNVLALGFTSLLTDISSEMVATVLPVYVVVHLGLTPLHFGVIDGIYNGATALLRLVGGIVADRVRRYKEVAAVGYVTSAVCKVMLAAAGPSWLLIAGIAAADRAAKGLRTAPRDALISLSSKPANLGISFGVHRALDSIGAMLGPLVGLAILTVLPRAFDVLFVASFSIALVGVGVLVMFVENKDGRADAATGALNAIAIHRCLEARGFRALILVAFVLSLLTVSDGFLYLVLLQRAGFNPAHVPLLYVATATSYLLLAIPAGWLADRFGRRSTFLAGYWALACGYVAALAGNTGLASVALCVVSLGCFYAMTDGVLMALASAIIPSETRGTGLALLTTLTSVGRLLGSFAFGALWTAYGVTAPLVWFFGGVLVTTLGGGWILWKSMRHRTQQAVE